MSVRPRRAIALAVFATALGVGAWRQAGSAKGLITVPDDFDEPLDDFKFYM